MVQNPTLRRLAQHGEVLHPKQRMKINGVYYAKTKVDSYAAVPEAIEKGGWTEMKVKGRWVPLKKCFVFKHGGDRTRGKCKVKLTTVKPKAEAKPKAKAMAKAKAKAMNAVKLNKKAGTSIKAGKEAKVKKPHLKSKKAVFKFAGSTAYLINLPQDTKRKALAKTVLAPLGLDLKVFAGVYGKDIIVSKGKKKKLVEKAPRGQGC